MRKRAIRITNKVFPSNSRRRRILKRLIQKKNTTSTTSTLSYSDWIKTYENKLFLDKAMGARYKKPLISIVVPCYNTPRKYISPLIDSVLSQKYTNWQLCIADGSTDHNRSKIIESLCKKDERITYRKLQNNQGIVGNTNEGLKLAEGEFIAFLDHDDVLSEFTLKEVVDALNKDEKLDLIYSDEDKLSDDGKERLIPFFKPDWSPELLLGVNYITHFVVARKSLVDKIGGLRPGFDGAQDYDFLLRFTELTNKIHHIPKILYHWRLAKGSTSKDVGQKNYADTAGRRALSDAIKRRHLKADVVMIEERPTNYRLKYRLTEQPLVSIIIPFKDKANLLEQCLKSIFKKTTYDNYEVILISNNSTEPETHNYLNSLKANNRCKIYFWDHPFNYSAINNFGSKKAAGEYLVLLNNDTEVITPSWLEELVGVAYQPNIGAVGPLLYYPNMTIQHAGVILGMRTMAGHVFRNLNPSNWTHFGLPAWPRDYLAVTGACLVIEKKKYNEMKGLDEQFTVAGNDVAFGIKLHEAGYRNVYWPFAELIHYENVSVGSYNNVPKHDYDHSLEYYRPYLNWKDPYFNPNLSLMDEQISLRGNYYA